MNSPSNTDSPRLGGRMKQVLRLTTVVALVVVFALASATVAAPALANSEDEPNLRSYITVVVTEDESDPDNVVTRFTITWNDAEDCSAEYNAYFSNGLDVAYGGDTTHLGSAATDGSQITRSLSNVEGEGIIFDVELYCGTEDSGRLVSSVEIPKAEGSYSEDSSRSLVPGTYSSEPPLTALTISHGTLTPAFHSHIEDYTVPDVAQDNNRITVTTTAKTGYTVVLIKDLFGTWISCSPWTMLLCTEGYQDTYGNEIDPLNDADADAPGFQVDLDEGENKLTVRVYRGVGYIGEFYRLRVTRAELPGPTATIELSPSGRVEEGTEITVNMSFGGLEQDFDRSDVDYIFRADVKNSSTGNADGCEGYGLGVDRFMHQVDEDPEVRTGSISASCEPGAYTVQVSLSSPGNVELASAIANFTVTPKQQQTPGPPSADATLGGLALSGIDLGAFDPATTGYTAEVAFDVTKTTVTPTTNDEGATYVIKVHGWTILDGVIHLGVGSNFFTIKVTAEDGNTTKTYTVLITRAEPPSSVATLSGLALRDVAFGAFDPARLEYTAEVGNEVTETTVSATVRVDGATYAVQLDGVADDDGVVPLAVGVNVITIKVTSANGKRFRIYRVTVTRAEPLSTDATLSGLALSGVAFGAFDPATTGYTAEVANDVTKTTVTPTANHEGATYAIKLDGVTDADGVIPLAVGSNVITIEVTAEDGNTAKTYTVTVTRAERPASEPAVAIGLSPSGSVAEGTEIAVTMSFGGLESDSDTATTDYIFRADVKDADACEGEGMGNDRYMYKVDEDPEVRTGTISPSCAPGDYTVEVSISSPGNVELASATADFTVAAPAEQPQPLSADAKLSGLTLSDVTLAFASTTTGYTASVANDVTQTTVTPTTNDDEATYAINLGGLTDADGVIPLAVGSNVITVEVTAEDGNTVKTYTVTVTRAAPPAPGPAVAVELSPSGSVDEGTEIALTMSFANLESDSDTSDTDYIFRADVVNADACEGGGMGLDRYMYKVDEDPEVRTGSISTSCAPGDYTVEVSISSPANVELASATADFTVAAPGQQQQPEPPASTDATLSNLTLSNVDFGAFDSATTGYTASVANDVTQTTVTPTTNDDGATYEIKLSGVADADAIISLSVGANVITVEVTAEDGNTIKTYTVTVTRTAALRRRHPERTDPERSQLREFRLGHHRVHRQRRQRRDSNHRYADSQRRRRDLRDKAEWSDRR